MCYSLYAILNFTPRKGQTQREICNPRNQVEFGDSEKSKACVCRRMYGTHSIKTPWASDPQTRIDFAGCATCCGVEVKQVTRASARAL
jgi:hypothetical protein